MKYLGSFSKNLNLISLLTICLCFLCILIINRNTIGGSNQWDFRAHYFSAKAAEAGLNPYNNHDVNELNKTPYLIPPNLTYPYHPFTLVYFSIFTKLEYPFAIIAYMVFNISLILLLIVVLKKVFFPEQINVVLFTVNLLFSFNSALFLGLKAGNPAILEAFIIWLALASFVTNRPLVFLLLISTIAFFKGTPLVLASMIFLLPDKRKNVRLAFFLVLAVISLWLSPLLFSPRTFLDYWHYSSSVRETGIINPCAVSFLGDLFRSLHCNNLGIKTLAYALWIVIISAIYFISIRKLNSKTQRVEMAILTIFTYALIVPRFKDYAYIQLLPASYFLMTRNSGMVFLNLFSLFAAGLKLPTLVADYYPFMAIVVNWGYLCYYLSREANSNQSHSLSHFAKTFFTFLQYLPFIAKAPKKPLAKS